jgi:DNA-binding transcriptional regulator YdaS (Cro superfamily)
MKKPLPLTEVIAAVGGKSALARLAGVKRQAVQQWRQVPARHCVTIEAATAGQVTCQQMRPDIFRKAA